MSEHGQINVAARCQENSRSASFPSGAIDCQHDQYERIYTFSHKNKSNDAQGWFTDLSRLSTARPGCMAEKADVESVEEKRLFISGIAESLSKDELRKRLESYGTVSGDLVLNQKNAIIGRIFGHCTVSISQSQWSRLKKLSGTVLKGSKLRIEEARQDWLTKKIEDEQRPQPRTPNPRKRPPVDTIPAIESKRVKRGEIVKDSSITQKSRSQGWIKGRYGRAIAILKTENGIKLSRNPDALSKLWGTAPARPDQLPYYYDDEEEEWHDRRGRVMKDVEIFKKRKPVEDRQGGRVEIWGSEDEDERLDDQNHYTVASSAQPDYQPMTGEQEMQEIDEKELDEQLTKERSLGMDLLGEMFKDTEAAETAEVVRKEKHKLRDKLDIVARFDPNAPEPESESEVESEEQEMNIDETIHQSKAADPIAATKSSLVDPEEVSDDEPLPSFLKPRQDVFNTEDLTSIFKPRKENDEVKFSLFGNNELSDVEEDEAVEQSDVVPQDTQDIHPDRLNRSNVPEVYENDVEENANYTALAKDRGFNLSGLPISNGVFPLLLSTGPGSFWSTQSSLFRDVLDPEVITREWEASRAEVTRDWKRKRREGTKKSRKASARQGR